MAAAYPVEPTQEQKATVITFLNSFALMYPCRECGTHFQKLLEKYPIKNGSRLEFANYMCFLHNKVNERLKKPIFDCSKVLEYWGGDCGCSGNK